jgi:hypothetical protein
MNSKVTNQTIRRLTLWYFAEYLVDNYGLASVNRNLHMNAFGKDVGDLSPELTSWPRNPAIDPKNKGKRKIKAKMENVRFLLADFLSRIDWTEIQGLAKIDLLTLLTNTLKRLKKELFAESAEKMDADTCAAFLVDFINYVGGQMGVDYGLYTGDITHNSEIL